MELYCFVHICMYFLFSLIVFQQAVLGSHLMDRRTDGHIRKYTIPELC